VGGVGQLAKPSHVKESVAWLSLPRADSEIERKQCVRVPKKPRGAGPKHGLEEASKLSGPAGKAPGTGGGGGGGGGGWVGGGGGGGGGGGA